MIPRAKKSLGWGNPKRLIPRDRIRRLGECQNNMFSDQFSGSRLHGQVTADVRGGTARRWDSFRVGDHSPTNDPTRGATITNESGSATSIGLGVFNSQSGSSGGWAVSASYRRRRAEYTSPIPPAPSGERISYGPSLVPGASVIVFLLPQAASVLRTSSARR